MPRPVVDRLNGALVAAVRDPANSKSLINQGAEPIASTPDEHAATIKSEIARWRKVAREAEIEPQ
jgi:tripartite-type tricarboxylate transporter receptor subunit TctC